MTKSIPLIDLLLVLFLTIILVNYDHQAQLAPEAFLMVIQLGLLWGFCRILYFLFPTIPKYIVAAILLMGFVQAVWGLGQWLGYFPSRHALFSITGSFFNPGPFGGFIALVLPLVLHCWLRYRKNKVVAVLLAIVGVACLAIFPATFSRTAWIAAVAGCGLVLVFDTALVDKLKNAYRRYRKTVLMCTLVFCVLCAGAAYGVFHLKTDSANGRLFMWKITALAIQDAPVTGVGLGGFPAAYADAQMAYFGSGRATETERMVAGSPAFAFNEYLRMFLEQGVVGGLLFLLLTFLIIHKGIKNRQTGAVGSFVALSVFAFASYPYSLWEFLIVWVLLGTMCVATGEKTLIDRRKTYLLAVPCLAILLVASFFVGTRQLPYRQAVKEWQTHQRLFFHRDYQSAVMEYARLYLRLSHSQRFIFEYATALNEIARYNESNRAASRGIQISSDPVFRNIKGRNYHAMGEFDKAERQLKKAIDLLPDRITPHYLLTRLYADPNNFQPEKMRRNAAVVLEKEPRVFSIAVAEMRESVREILRKWD